MAGSSVPLDFQPGAFMHKIFEHRQVSINELKTIWKTVSNGILAHLTFPHLKQNGTRSLNINN